MSRICMGCMSTYGDEFYVCPFCGFVEGTKAAEALHMDPGSILSGRYIIGRVVGFGGFGVTYIGWDAVLEQKVAIKEYLPSEFATRVPGQTHVTVFNGAKQEQFEDGLSKFVEEAQRLARFHSLEGIVKIFDSFTDNNTAYIVMEYLDGETLQELLKRENTIPVEQAIAMLTPVIQSLQVVHQEGIIHRDIAPDNIFLTSDGKVKLIDFGASRYATTSHSRSLTVIIKPGYSPEEQYRSRGDQGSHTDVYAIGATLYRMITGVTPPDALERRAFFESKKKDILTPPSRLCKQIGDNQETAILNALNVRIEDRTPDMATLEEELTAEEPVKRRQGRIKKLDVLKWSIWEKISAPAASLMVLALVLLLSLGVIVFARTLQEDIVIPDGMARVPSVVNYSLEDAERILTEAGLLYSIVGKQYSNLIPVDLILTQGISAGSIVAQNTVIQVTISGGAETRTVPDVTGMYVKSSVKELEELGFAVQVETEYSMVFADGTVISQSVPGDGELMIGSTIVLTVSKGLDPQAKFERVMRIVPDFVGLSFQETINAALGAGFLLAVKAREFSGEFDKSIVMTQSVIAGSENMSGNIVELVVSLGIRKVKVPDVQYKPEAEARKLLVDQGLTVGVTYVISETVANGLVISQDPAARTTVGPNTKVELVVSKGSEYFAMPNVIGMGEAEARSVLLGKGLSISVNYEYSASGAEGAVLQQSVAANTQVNRGTSVTITVCSAKEVIGVADVVGRIESDARNTLTSQGFKVSVVKAYSDTVAAGVVISQSPAAGTSLVKNSTVALVVSQGQEFILVPNVTGLTQTIAGNTLNDLGLKTSIKEEFSGTVPKGSVISQSPNVGSKAKKDDTVTLTVSKGKEQVTVPNVVGQGKSAAENALKASGLRVNYQESYDDKVQAGYVISQDPSGGTTAFSGDLVTLTVSLGAAPNPPKDLTLNPSSMTLTEGGTGQIAAVIDPADAIDKTIAWSSANTSIATVSSGGLVTAISPGTTTVTATTNTGKITKSCSVTVMQKTVTNIEVSSQPVKTQYNYGETLNTSGLTLKVTYNNNTVEYVSSGFTCTPNTLSTPGAQTITVSYGGKTTTFSVTVVTVLTGIRVTTPPTKTDYFTGESLSTSGLAVNADYSDGSSKNVTSSCSLSGFSSSNAGTITVTASYSESGVTKTASFTVTVIEPVLTEIRVSTSPTKTIYDIGDALSTNGLAVTASYSDGSSKNVTTSCVLGTLDSSSAGRKTITVSYSDGGITMNTSFEVEVVVKLARIETTTLPTKTTYYLGESLNTSGITVMAYYTDSTSKTVTPSCTYTGFSSTNVGAVTVTVSYSEGGLTRTTTFSVTITDSKPVNSVTVSPDIVSLTSGGTRRLTATVLPADATNKAVTWSSSSASVATVDSSGNVTAVGNGSAVITATAADNGLTATCDVTVASMMPGTSSYIGPKSTINPDVDYYLVPAAGGEYNITYYARLNSVVEYSQPWFDNRQYNNNRSDYTILPNDNEYPREGYVLAKKDNVENQRLWYLQCGIPEEFNITLPRAGGSVTQNLPNGYRNSAYGSLGYSSYPSWLDAPALTQNTSAATFTIKADATSVARSTTIMLYIGNSKHGAFHIATVNITQG